MFGGVFRQPIQQVGTTYFFFDGLTKEFARPENRHAVCQYEACILVGLPKEFVLRKLHRMIHIGSHHIPLFTRSNVRPHCGEGFLQGKIINRHVK